MQYQKPVYPRHVARRKIVLLELCSDLRPMDFCFLQFGSIGNSLWWPVLPCTVFSEHRYSCWFSDIGVTLHGRFCGLVHLRWTNSDSIQHGTAVVGEDSIWWFLPQVLILTHTEPRGQKITMFSKSQSTYATVGKFLFQGEMESDLRITISLKSSNWCAANASE